MLYSKYPAGLNNSGNTCFLNASIQCLASCNLFYTAIKSSTHQRFFLYIESEVPSQHSFSLITNSELAINVMTRAFSALSSIAYWKWGALPYHLLTYSIYSQFMLYPLYPLYTIDFGIWQQQELRDINELFVFKQVCLQFKALLFLFLKSSILIINSRSPYSYSSKA